MARVRVGLERDGQTPGPQRAQHDPRRSRSHQRQQHQGCRRVGADDRSESARLDGAPRTPAAAQAAPAAAARHSSPEGARAKAGATQLRSVRIGKIDNGYSVTLAGNGPLLAAKVDATSELPHRVFLDFAGVAAGSAPAVTAVNNDDIERVRVAVNSRQPLITRVVIDLARKIPYTVETVGEELRVLFKKAVDKAVETAAAITEPVIAPPVAETAAAEPVAVAADVAPAAEPQSNVVASAVTVPPMPPTADVPSMTAAVVSVPAAPGTCCTRCTGHAGRSAIRPRVNDGGAAAEQ